MDGLDDWYCLYHDGDYLLIYCCGAAALDAYRGGILLSRSPDTNDDPSILSDVDSALANAGLFNPVSLADFGTNDNTLCLSP